MADYADSDRVTTTMVKCEMERLKNYGGDVQDELMYKLLVFSSGRLHIESVTLDDNYIGMYMWKDYHSVISKHKKEKVCVK